MNDQEPQPIGTDDPAPPADATSPLSRAEQSGRRTAKTTIAGALFLGGIAGAAILGPLTATAATPTPTAAASTTAPSSTSAPAATTGTDTDTDHQGGPGGHVEAVTDASVVAKAIGITEADLTTALASGKTVAQIASADGVALQKVIDALVADGKAELAAQVANGSMTQAQADAAQSAILQRATDQANGSLIGGPGGPGDHGGPGGPGGHTEAVSDTSAAAKAIGITEAELTTALAGGQTVAQVATAKGVAVQKVIDALVADGTSELAAEVSKGSITQAQADAEKTEVTQRATDQVNGTFSGGRP